MKAIAVIDMKNDFIWKEFEYNGAKYYGKLVAPLGKTIIEPCIRMIDAGIGNGYEIFYIGDEHPENSKEFKKWGPHCVIGTPGAETIPKLIRKGKDIHYIGKDDYSGFTNPELDKLLKEKNISEVYLVGLVQEVCIKENAKGFLNHRYKVNVVVDATVPFNSYKGYVALKEIEEKGARLIDLETALEEIKKQ